MSSKIVQKKRLSEHYESFQSRNGPLTCAHLFVAVVLGALGAVLVGSGGADFEQSAAGYLDPGPATSRSEGWCLTKSGTLTSVILTFERTCGVKGEFSKKLLG